MFWTLCAAFLVFANWPLGLDDGRTEERTRMAEEYAAQGRSDDADAWAAKAEEGNPQPALVELRVGRALLAHGDPATAVRHLQRASDLDPGHAQIEYALGQALLDAGRPRDAVPHLKQAVAHGVRSDVAGFDLARALAADGDRDEAIGALATVTPANRGDAASWLALGDFAVQLDAPALEEKFYAAAVSADPDNATARLNLAVVYAQQGRTEDARRNAEAALKLKPDYAKAKQLLSALPGRKYQ